MKTQKRKSLTLAKASIANLDKQTIELVKGGNTRAWTDCNSINYSLCATSCHAH